MPEVTLDEPCKYGCGVPCSERLGRAVVLAFERHEGQTYLDGPYTEHLTRVCDRLVDMGYGDEDHQIVGMLHDVVEDTDATLDEIEEMFGPVIAMAVEAITRRVFTGSVPKDPNTGMMGIGVAKETEGDYLARVCANKLATHVKWADMSDNLLMCRGVNVPEHKRKLWTKYTYAMQYLAERF